MQRKHVAIVAPHFTPSNVTSVHRARLWSLYLRDYGWEPIIVTVDWKYYEEELDWDLHNSVPTDVEVCRTRALSTKPIRFVGDIGLRGFPWLYKALSGLAVKRRIDFVLITIPSNYASLLGRLIYRRHKVPYGIDYIDPWVHQWPAADKLFSKAWWSLRLAKILEPWAVRHASLITGVADSYYAEVLQRNPQLSTQAVVASMPYGIAPSDYDHALKLTAENDLYDCTTSEWNIIYAGAMLPHSFSVLDVLFKELSVNINDRKNKFERLRLRFVGTGKGVGRTKSNLEGLISKYALNDYVREYPMWASYLSVLRHLKKSDAILILGSDRKHYTPSKVYQAIFSGKPILAVLQKDSATLEVLRKYDKSSVVTFDEVQDLNTRLVVDTVISMMNDQTQSEGNQHQLLDMVGAESSAKLLADALSLSLEKSNEMTNRRKARDQVGR